MKNIVLLTIIVTIFMVQEIRAQVSTSKLSSCAMIENDIGRLSCYDGLVATLFSEGQASLQINAGVVMKSGDVKKEVFRLSSYFGLLRHLA